MHGGALVGALMGCDPSRIHYCVIYPHGSQDLILRASFGLKMQNPLTETVDQSLPVIYFKFPVRGLSGKFKRGFFQSPKLTTKPKTTGSL